MTGFRLTLRKFVDTYQKDGERDQYYKRRKGYNIMLPVNLRVAEVSYPKDEVFLSTSCPYSESKQRREGGIVIACHTNDEGIDIKTAVAKVKDYWRRKNGVS